MHPIPVVDWSSDCIRATRYSGCVTGRTGSRITENATNSSVRLRRSDSRCMRAGHSSDRRAHHLVSTVFTPISSVGRRRCLSCVSILLLTIALNCFLQLNAATAPLSTPRSAPLESNKSIDSLSLPQQPKSNPIRNSSSSHLKDQFLRTVRSAKLAGHRLKHRRSSSAPNKGYQPAGKHSAPTNNWSVLGDQDAEYALKMLESEHLTSAILHFIEITYKYAENNLPALQAQNEPNGTLDGKRFANKYYNTGSCVQVRLDSLRGLLRPKSFAKYEKQAQTAKRTASLLTTLLSERLEITSDRSYAKSHYFGHSNDTSNIVLHKAFFWSLLKVNLQSDPNLFANGIVFRPDLDQFPIKLFSTTQSNKEDHRETSTNSSTSRPFSPYIFRKKPNSFGAKPSAEPTTNRTYNYVNLSGVGQWSQRIVPNPNLKLSVADLQGLMEEKAANLNQLKHSLYNKKQPEPNTYSYSSDWYTVYADKYLNNSQPFNYHELAKSLYLNSSTEQGYWTVPYSDCMVTGSWLLSYSVPFFGLSKSTNQIEFKGVVLISIDLSDQDINQCSPDDPFFPSSHKCDRETTECIPIKGLGFRRGAYVCECKPSFYIPNVTYSSSASLKATIKNQTDPTSPDGSRPARHYFNGTAVESAFIDTHAGLPKALLAPLFPAAFQCVACPKDCSECESNQSCKVSYTSPTRVFVLGVQSFCATISLILAVTTFRLRRSKSFASSRWIILEALLFGSLLLYITVIVQYFEPKPLNCFLVPWFREVGFGFVYGSIIIKLYRIYAEFQTRKAHRVCVRDKDLLKYLCAIILVITGYMAAWSALILETINGFANLVNESAEVYIIQIGRTVDNLKFVICKQLSWDYVTELGELSFILAGFYMSYSIRNARSEFYREKWALCTCIYIEFVISGSFYILRYFLWDSLHPDLIYLMYFVRCQLTVTVVLALIFGPKIFFQNRPPATNTRKSRFFTGPEPSKQDARLPEQAMKLHAAILSNGEIDVSDINLAEMDPEDIRTELRRVYTQLQVLKNKTIRKDNPHISKRRGGRKTHRRFSLQFNAHNKHVHKSHHYHPDHEQEITEVSRTPEESTASLEQSTVFADGQSSVLSSK